MLNFSRQIWKISVISSFAILAFLLMAFPQSSYATDFTAGTAAELVAAINNANNNTATPGADTITLIDADFMEHTTVQKEGGSGYKSKLGRLTANTSLLNITPTEAPISFCNVTVVTETELQDAINLANNEVACPGINTITFDATIELLVFHGFTISSPVILMGKNHSLIAHNQYDWLGFQIDTDGHLTLNDLTLSYFHTALINHGTTQLNKVTISNNKTDGRGGGVLNSLDATLEVVEGVFKNNTAEWGGAGINNEGTLTVRRTEFSDNLTKQGDAAAIYNGGAGTMTVEDSQFTNNQSQTSGGAILSGGVATILRSTFTENRVMDLTSGCGGAIRNTGIYSVGIMTISGSLFSQNQALISGAVQNSGILTIINSTLSGNIGSGNGGAIQNIKSLTVDHSTFVNNISSAGVIINWSQNSIANAEIRNSIFVDTNLSNTCQNVGDGAITVVNNLSTDGMCGTISVTNLDLTLADNGGDTLTHALLPGSNAINASGDCSAAPINGVDQRGFPRDSQCDIGAFELQVIAPTETTTAADTAVPTATDTPTATETVIPTATETATTTETAVPTVTETSTAIPTSTETATDVPTFTPVPTTTPDSTSLELLVNGGFETDTDGDNQPDGWQALNATSDKIKCNTATKTVAHDGNCAYQFKGSQTESSQLRQTIDLTTFPLAAGDTLTLSGAIHAKGLVNTKIKVLVIYPTTPKGKLNLNFTAPTEGYVVFDDTLILAEAPTKIRVTLYNQSKSSRVWYDGFSLKYQSTSGLGGKIPLPIAP